MFLTAMVSKVCNEAKAKIAANMKKKGKKTWKRRGFTGSFNNKASVASKGLASWSTKSVVTPIQIRPKTPKAPFPIDVQLGLDLYETPGRSTGQFAWELGFDRAATLRFS